LIYGRHTYPAGATFGPSRRTRSGEDSFVNQAVEVLAEVGIADIAHQPLNSLSGGDN
jgi:ABC-type Mn2+/Zn2+ transport system ATPase subunit